MLLRGFSSFFKASGKGQLWLIGDGPDRQELEAMATELGIANQVVFWGARFGEEKLNLLANSDAFFHPSRYEGLPTAVLEASGLALPVVVSEATNLAEAVAGSQAGYVLQSNTCESIHKACFEILEDKTTGDLKKKGQNGRLMVASRFSWKQISQELIHIYND
ncbi:MAG: glycosyltransferase family 4 protein [Salibacteraceae bacterium]